MTKRIVLSLLCACTLLAAQALTLKGTVKTQGQAPLPYTSVYLKDVQIGTTTDLDGNYQLADVPAGRHTLVVSYIGYASLTMQLDLTQDDVRDFTLAEQAVTLSEVFVTPNGERIERFILRKTTENYQKLSKRVSHYDLTMTVRAEQRNNQIKVLLQPYLKTLNFFLGMMGLKNVFNYIIDHPDCRVEMECKYTLDNGKQKAQEPTIIYCSHAMNEDQQKSWKKVFGKIHNGNDYDEVYEELIKEKKALEKMDRKKPGESEKILTYEGGYEEEGHSVHILGYENWEVHIIDGCWQVRRLIKKDKKNRYSSIMEFGELAKDFYMPVSIYRESEIDFEDFIKDEIKDLKKENESTKKKSKLEKNNEQIEKLEHLLESGAGAIKHSTGFVYKNFRLTSK